jgi:Ca2+-binding RTX toxin-like protein
VYGFQARDRLYGDSGADKVFGNTGPDQLFAGAGVDRVFGDGGDDFINMLDERGGDVADCGVGNDEVYADLNDDVNFAGTGGDCEATFQAGATFGLQQDAGTLGPKELRALPEGTFVEKK